MDFMALVSPFLLVSVLSEGNVRRLGISVRYAVT
jgi:hypothetical protein